MQLKNLSKYLPFVGIHYFRKQRRQFINLLSQLEENEMAEWYIKFQKLNAKHVGYNMLSIVPGFAYSASVLDPVPLILNMAVSFSYGDAIYGCLPLFFAGCGMLNS